MILNRQIKNKIQQNSQKKIARFPQKGNIYEATVTALDIDGYIVNTDRSFLFIKPTNETRELCKICIGENNSARGWQPSATDLISQNWSAVTEQEFLALSSKRGFF